MLHVSTIAPILWQKLGWQVEQGEDIGLNKLRYSYNSKMIFILFTSGRLFSQSCFWKKKKVEKNDEDLLWHNDNVRVQWSLIVRAVIFF